MGAIYSLLAICFLTVLVLTLDLLGCFVILWVVDSYKALKKDKDMITITPKIQITAVAKLPITVTERLDDVVSISERVRLLDSLGQWDVQAPTKKPNSTRFVRLGQTDIEDTYEDLISDLLEGSDGRYSA